MFVIWSLPGLYVAVRRVRASAPVPLAAAALGYPAAWAARAAFHDELGAHAQGAVLQESIFAGSGRQSRAEPVVLARDAQEFPLMRNESVTHMHIYVPPGILTHSSVGSSHISVLLPAHQIP